jgi:hypothetical protein
MPEPTPQPEASPASHHVAQGTRSASGWVAPAALVISLIAAVAAGWALLRPAPPQTTATSTGPTTAAQGSGDAKTNACDAFRTVTSAVSLQTHADAGADPAAVQGIAANARLAMAGGATYLLAHVSTGTPTELADAIRSFASQLQDISMNALAGLPNSDPAQAARLHDAETANNRIAELCK